MLSRLYLEFNPSPIPILNQDWQGGLNPQTKKPDKSVNAPDPANNPEWVQAGPAQNYARAAHPEAELSIVAYDGLVNRASWFSDPAGNLLDRGAPLTGDRPVDPLAAAKAIANLALHPSRYGDATALPFRAIFYDLEAPGNPCFDHNASIPQRRGQYQYFIDAIKAMRSLSDELPVFIGGYPWRQSDGDGAGIYPKHNAGCEDLDKQLASLVSGAVLDAYNWDVDVVSNGTTWLTRLQQFDRLLDKEYPDLHESKVAFLTPIWNVYWPQNLSADQKPLAARANQPLPIDIWKKQNQYLIDRGYDRFVWLGSPLWATAPVKAHIDAL